MRIVLTTESAIRAIHLKEEIIRQVSHPNSRSQILTWSYIKSKEGYDIIYHNLEQYVSEPAKNVLFRLQSEGESVILSTVWWSVNPEPSHEMFSLHVGRVTEMILNYFSSRITSYTIQDF